MPILTSMTFHGLKTLCTPCPSRSVYIITCSVNSLVWAPGCNLLFDLSVHSIRRCPAFALSLHLQDNFLLSICSFTGALFSLLRLEDVFLLHFVSDGALLHSAVCICHMLFDVLGPLWCPLPTCGGVWGRLGYPGMIVPFGDGPGLVVLLVLGLAVEGCFWSVVLVLGFTARFGSHSPVLKVLAHHRAAHALFRDAPSRRACRVGVGLSARRLRFYGDPGLRRLQLDMLHLRDVRVLGENQRHRNVSLVQLVPEAGHAARPADTGPRHAEAHTGPLTQDEHRIRDQAKIFLNTPVSCRERNKMSVYVCGCTDDSNAVGVRLD